MQSASSFVTPRRHIDFYEKVFGAKQLYSLTMPNGGIAHAEFKIGDTIIMIADENPEWGNKSPETLGGSSVELNVMVDNPDVTVAEAEKAGGKVFSLSPISSTASGRAVSGPFGHVWIVSKVLEEVSPKEMQKRMEAIMGGMQEKGSAEAGNQAIAHLRAKPRNQRPSKISN